MKPNRGLAFSVGVFMLLALAALFVLAIKVSNLSHLLGSSGYEVTAEFDNVGSLKVRAPVSIAGVKVGEIHAIDLDSEHFRAIVHMSIHPKFNHIPEDATARILTQGLLGGNYISLSSGFASDDEERTFLHDGSRIEETHQAIVLEDLIGQLLFSMKNEKK